MNKRRTILYSILIILLLLVIVGCDLKKDNNTNTNNEQSENINSNSNSNEEINSVKIVINDIEYTINFENNETVKSFVNLLPQEFTMDELNGNEKYVYLDEVLLTDVSVPKIINAGDVMLYGNNCLVIFYKSFNTSYSYTKIGHIDGLPDLGTGSIKVKFEK